METIHHAHLHKYNAAVAAGTATTYNATMPWDAVWSEATTDTEWWKAEFEMPAMRIKFERSSPARVLNDTARENPVRPQKPGTPKPKAQPKKGEICRDFNNGKCAHSTDGMCPRHAGAIHKCSQCGSPAHGAKDCGAGKGKRAAPAVQDWTGKHWKDAKRKKGR